MTARHVLSPLVFALAAALGATTLSACKKPEYPACKKDKHCDKDAGETCVDNICQNCTADTDCAGQGPDGGDWTCVEHRCTDPAAAGDTAGGGAPGEVGAPCTDEYECFGGLACVEGTCNNCMDDSNCMNGACNLNTGRCDAADSCQTDDQCPMGEICDGGMCIYTGEGEQQGLCALDAVYFAFDSDALTPSTQESLTTAASCIAEQEGSLTLEAHADNVGEDEYNILLTDKRGQGVKNFLTNNGVPAEKVTVVGKGSLEAMGTDESSRSKDRRVDFIWN